MEKKWVKMFTFAYDQGREANPAPPHTASPTVKYLFFTSSLRTLMLLTKLRIAYLKLVQLLLHRLHLHHHLAHQLLAT